MELPFEEVREDSASYPFVSSESMKGRELSLGPCLKPSGRSVGAVTHISGSYMQIPSSGTPVYFPLKGRGQITYHRKASTETSSRYTHQESLRDRAIGSYPKAHCS